MTLYRSDQQHDSAPLSEARRRRTRELLARVRRIEIRTRKKVDQLTAGAYHSVFKGRGIDFSEVREYQQEDDIRNIEWNVTARFGRPFVKQFVEERELSVLLLVDISASGDCGSGGRTKNDQAAELAALLVFSAIRNRDRAGLLLFTSDSEIYLPPRPGRRHALRLVRELLARPRRHRRTNIGMALQRAMQILPRRSVIFLVSDMLDRGYGIPLALASRRHDLVGVRIADPCELQVPPVGYLAVQDAEQDGRLVFAGKKPEARRRYSRQARQIRVETEAEFGRARVDLIDIMVGQDVVGPLMNFFRTRKKRH